MEMFNVHRRDIFNFDDYMDLKKPAFGGPKSAKQYLDARGKKVNDSPKLKEYQRVVTRHPAFGNQVYNPTYKAMTNDLVYKQEKREPLNYPDSYNNMGLPVVMVGKSANEGLSITSFNQFINEMYDYGMNPKEKEMSVRGKTDLDAISDAEEKMLDSKIDWENFYYDKGKARVDYTDVDGDLVAYLDLNTRKLIVMPDAPAMSDEKYSSFYETTPEEEEEDYYDEYENEEEEEDSFEPENFRRMPSAEKYSRENTEDIERLLKSFED